MKGKRILQGMALLLALLSVTALASCRRAEGDYTDELIDLGIPLIERYTNETQNDIRARCSEDMVIYDGRLYVGCGDYSTNKGPVNIYSYGLADGEWQTSAETLDDEHIKRFLVLDGTLCIPGTDPRGDWSLGNYYTLADGAWQTHRVLPSGIHCFDGVVYEGKTFWGLGVNSGDFPVVVQSGEALRFVPFVRDGAAVDTAGFEFVRVHNFSVYNGELYAFFTLGNTDTVDYSVYRYDGEVFVYVSTPPEVFLRSYDISHTASFAGLNTFINGYCYYVTEDMSAFRPWRVGDSDLACDMEQIGDTLYVLAHRTLENGDYETGVYATKDGKEFEKLFYFHYDIPANSFAYADGTFYFSMGRYYDGSSDEMGRVFALDFKL